MATVKEFENIMGPLKEAIIEEGNKMEFEQKVKLDRDERIKDMEDKDGNYGKRRFILYCDSGNVYSTFITEAEIAKIHNKYSVGDVAMITYTERPDKNDPDKIWLNLEGMSEKRGSDIKPITASGNPLLDSTPTPEPPVSTPPGTLCPPLTGKVTTSVPLPLPDTPKSVGTPISRDLSIIRQVSWKASVEFIKALASAGLVNDVDGAVEIAVSTAHSIEEDINREA